MILWDCSGDDAGGTIDDVDVANRDSIISYLERNNLIDSTEEHSSGIFYQRVIETTGSQVSSGAVLSIYYEANALDEQAYARVSSDAGDDAVRLQYGTNSVYPVGLDTGLGLMRQGETFIFYIPSSLAYGALSDLSSIIPPNSVIVMTVELALIESEADVFTQDTTAFESLILLQKFDSLPQYPVDSFEVSDEGLYYKRTFEGIEDSIPRNGRPALINYEAYKLIDYPNGSSFASEDQFVFDLGAGSVIEGLDLGILQMEFGERALFLIPSSLAYGASAFVIPEDRKQYLVNEDVIPQYAAEVSPYEALVFEVELLSPPMP